MDLLAQYTMVDRQTLTDLLELDDSALIEAVIEINSADAGQVLGIDKLWDGLHFLLTGAPAQKVMERSLLSRAAIGSQMFIEDDDAFFVNYTTAEELPKILEAMRQVNLTALVKKFKPALFRQNGIYPDIWRDEHEVALFCELSEAFQSLLEFYAQAQAKGRNIIFSVY